MIKSKLLKVITLATGLMAAGASFGANGDIFEIRPCDQDGQSVSYNVDINNPMTSGESLYFKVRLIRRSKTDNNSTWTIKPNFGNMPSGDYEDFPEEFKLGLGIYVSGQERYAVLDSWKSGTVDSTGLFTDLIFKYKTRAGDVALPIVLATENGPASDNIVEDAAYKLRNENIWEITNGNGNSCNFWFWSMTLMPESDWGIWGGVSSPDGGDPVQDYSLAKCNFYVQTINFDETWEEEGKIWRSVHANSTITAAGLSPKLVAKAPPEDKVELYVWSTDENVVRVKSNETVELKMDASGATKTTQIGKVVFSGGQITPVDFQIEGVAGGSGQTCKLVLSPWKNYNYSNATSTRLTDYIEVPVKCLDPLPPTVTVETDRAVAYADGNYMVYGAVMSVYLSEAYDKDMTVKITPTIDGVDPAEIGSYLRFSEVETEVTALPAYEIPTVTIPAGSTAKKQVYIFCLRGDTFTTGTSRIVFTPSVEDADAAAFLKNYMTAGMQVVAEKPLITTPTEGAVFVGVCGEDTPFTLVVEDTYADSSDIEEGYKIFVKYRMTELWKELKGRYYVGEGGALFLIDENASGMDRKSTQFPVLNYPVSGEGIESQVKIVSPVSGKESEVRNFIANIKAPRTSEIIEVNDKMEFFEGEQATLQIKLSEPNDTGNTIYAYLRASENVTAGMLSGTPLFVICDDTDLTKTRGLEINHTQSATSKAKIKFLDGISDGLSVQFQVVLSTSKTFDGKQLSGYQSNYLNLTVYNQEPTIKRIEMNGNESEGSGFTYPNKIPKGMERTFVAVIDEKGTYDKTTTVDGEEFRCKWTLKREGQTYGDPIETKGDPAKNPLKFNFPQAGKWSVKLQVRDKDMDDWAEASYEVYLNVLDNPLVEISADDVYVENETKGRVFVGLSYWDDQFEGTLRVKLTVEEWVKDKVNYGCLKLDDKFKSTNPADGDNVYYVDLNSAAPVPVAITELDGTDDSSLYGFVVKAEVVSNNLLPTSNQSANSYYLAGEKQVLVYNADPVCEMSPGAPTNRWEVSGGVDMMHKLTWRVKSDVLNDLTTGLWKDGVNKGIKVSIMGPLNATEFYVDKATSGEFHPDFGDLQGDIDVTFLFEDKDGGSQIFTYQYTVKPSKFLVTAAHGPGGGLATSALSRRYASLDGIGAGHTFAEDVTFSSAKNFRLTWNCGSRQDVNIYGFGYKVANPVDDGSLDNGQDIALTPEGFNQTDINGPFYTYPPADAGVIYNDVKDSFFYCWLLHSVEEGSCVSTILGETFSPEQPGVVATGTAYLPVDKHDDGSFAKTEVEAIFAREYFREDNVGDINYDSIPDLFAHKTWQGGNMIELASGGTIVENNLIAINGFNLDGDRLPKVYEGGQNNFNYAPIGPAFNARLEIRGFHPGLNAIDIAKSDPSFCEFNDDGTVKRDNQGNLVNANELIAWREFMRARSEAEGTEFDENMMPTAADLLIWSPEPRGSEIKRMDPTVEDTDGDGFPDGWEYYLWYRAHVTARVPRSNVRFERFNYANILQGIAISPDEVEARFNPCEPLTSEAYGNNPDFDGDGLSDLEELAIGTNPCHWDTDGDRMCDGWEVMMNLNPLAPSDKRSNLDGDFMAYYEMNTVLGVDNGDGTVTFYPDLVRGEDYKIGVQIIEGVEVPDFETFVFLKDVKKTKAIVVRGLVNTRTTVDENTGEEILEEVPRSYGLEGEGEIWGCQLSVIEELTTEDFEEGAKLEGVSLGHPHVLLHDQVRHAFGFDPRTAWSNIDGYVATRWDPNKNNALGGGDMTGAAVNTREYTAYDEYLVMKYRHDVLNEAGFNDNDPWATLMSKTTNPSVVEPEIIDPDGNVAGGTANSATNDVANAATNATINTGAGNNNTTAQGVVAELLDRAFAEAGSNKTTRKNHGADTDGDGVPDGWELYMKRNPNMLPGENEDFLGEKDMRDYDDDGLNYVSEYAGTDSCNAYRDCPSIYAHHPGLAKGWYNKFFPTNPGEPEDMALAVAAADTDGDGITDAQEGASFPLDFYNAGVLFRELELNFIYGSPEDDGVITCIRGGGMNPCSVDTDLDAIPDGWEMQHAGVPVNARTKSVVPPSGLVGSDAAGKFADISTHFKNNAGTFLADGIYSAEVSTNGTASAIYIAGGMDATWAGDTGSDLAEKGTSWDELLGGARDVDFDHDGLQNYQEYYIQAVRHFRYDDISTPLMGRLLTENATVVDIPNDLGISVPTMIDANHTQRFMGYVPFDPSDPSYFVTMASIAWQDSEGYEALINDCINYEKADNSPLIREPWTVEGWRNLGYFAPPPKSWDRATVSGVLKYPLYMFPVTKEMSYRSAVAGYVTSDPRMADTDADGMDDFYEMFHGLNPILGTNWVEPDDTEWAYFGKKGDIISATYNQAIPEELFQLGYSSLATFNAYYNEWIYSSFMGSVGRNGRDDTSPWPTVFRSIKAPMALDPVMYPWLQGTAEVDSDGDGISNDSERPLANVADPMPIHTDPTPLWFTERTTPISFVAQYYMTPLAISQMPWYPSTKTEYQTVAQTAMSSLNYMFSFEEGEGYDTDGDFKYDGAEIITTFTGETDPLRFDDPARRQALYLSGKDSYAFSPQAQARLINAEDLLKQFTVECWVRPEKEGEAQTIIDRSFLYPGDNLATDKYAIRANFRIGLDAEGKIYGMFDNSHSIESGAEPTKSCQYVTGRKLILNEWAHVALTFDGSDLKLYIDGEEVKSASTQLIPANGIVQIIQNPGNTDTFPADMYSYRSGGLFIGARPVKAADVSVKDMPEAAFMINIVDEFGREYPETFSNVREFFGGYVDEVRVWDGARSSEDIKANYRKRFSFAEVKENRDSVLESWRLFEGTRNENDGKATLPPELLFHYNFTTLPGAVEPDYVAKTPAAFEGKVVDVANGNHYAMNDEIDTTGLYSYRNNRSATINDDICVGWWAASDLKNTVYNDYRVVPWIKNTVMHLTPPDGSSLDTFLYADKFGSAYAQASEHNLSDYTYNNSAQPYSSYALHLDLYQRLLQAELINEQLGDAFDWVTQYNEFALRGMFVGSTDLVPLGDAFARTCPKMWDRAVADAWEITGLDDDADGLPNWWEEYQKVNNSYADSPEKSGINWNSTVIRDGVEMTAGDAYKYDIAQGLQPNGEFNDAYRATIDSDGDNLPDWWESYYGIAGSIDTDDDDGDGLSNWAEYVLSEVFDLWTAGGKRAKFDPTDATSVSEFDLDYFFKIGELYAGEIFTDHDFMEDVFEDSWGKAYANRYAWDADSDSDEDGWTTWSEARYCAWAKTPVNPWISHIVGDTEIKDFPVPTLDLIIRYNGTQKLVDGEPLDEENGNESGEAEDEESIHVPLIVRTYTNPDLVKPDAEYLVKPGAEVVHYSPIGLFEKKIVRGTLPHGHINSAAFNLEWAEIHRNDYYTFQVKDLSELDSIWAQKWPAGVHIGTYKEFIELYNLFGDKYIILNSGQVNWNKAPIANYITITQDYTGEDSYICLRGKRIGKINLRTGVYELNLAEFYDEFHGDWTGSDGVLDWGDDEDHDVDDDDDEDNTHGKTEIEVESPTSSGMGQMMYRFQFTSIIPELQDNKLEIFLGLSGSGYVRGGKNTIVAFYDLNRDDEYTPGEPMGMVKDVDVGWRNGKVELELTDTNPMISRIDLSTGVSDRNQLWGIDGARDMTNTVGRLMENQFERVRVVRSYTIVRRIGSNGSIEEVLFDLPVKRVVLDKVMNMSQRPFLFEGDILGQGDLDLDWDYLYDEAINNKLVVGDGYDLTDIVYEVFFGDVEIPSVGQPLSAEAQANVLSTRLVRSFDSKAHRPTPEAITPGKNGIEVLKANPTFKWKMPNNSNTYTAFKIQIRSGSKVVWESGNGKPLPAPARDGNGVYTFEADAYIGDELENFSSYTWRVSMYNAKFKDDKWSDDLSFSMSVPENVVGYGSIPVAIKYFGPSQVSGASTFVVEAFTTRDFTGIPAARAVVTDPASVTVSDVQHPTNAVLTGLSTGRYFLRAYADLSTDGAVRRKRDSFESWGYACGRGEPGITPFVPTEFVLTDRNGFEKPVDIYIEDVDTNGNSLPDAWEYVENNGKLNVGVEDLDGNVLRAFGISKLLSAQLQDRVIGPYPVNAFNNYIITSLASPGMAALALNYNPNDVIVGENGSIQVESKVESVEIKSVAFNANGNVVVEVDAALNTDDGYSNGFGIIPVEVETRKTVTCQVLWKASLSDTAWTVKAEKTVVVGDGAQTIDINGLGAEKSGFFKVVVTE